MARKTQRRRHTKPKPSPKAKELPPPAPVADDAMRSQKIEAAIEAALAPIRARIEEQEQRYGVELARRDRDSVLTDAAIRNHVKPKAIVDYIFRAAQVFELDNGNLTAHDEDGPLFSPTKATALLSIDEWTKTTLMKEAPFLFERAKGS